MKKRMIRLVCAALALPAFFALSGCRQLFSDIAAVSKAVTINNAGAPEGSTAVVDNPDAQAGETVTLTITPHKHIKSFTISISGATLGAADNVSPNTFVMPDTNVNITVTFTQYVVDDPAPGGKIFYAKSSESDGWKYLVAADSSQVGTKTNFEDGPTTSCTTFYFTDFPLTKGNGKENTEKLITKGLRGSATAAKYCQAFTWSVNNWFLPTLDEMKELDKVLTPGTGSTHEYWTSNPQLVNTNTLDRADAVIYKMNGLGTGVAEGQTRTLQYKVWPVRRF